MNRISRTVILFIAQGAYAGRSPIAPGTAGTLVGVLIYLGMQTIGSAPYLLVSLLLGGIGTWAAARAEVLLGKKDDPSIVIDEIVGYLIALFLVPAGWGFIVSGFLLFRLFDIIKPWPLHRLQDLHGGPGIMLDDIGAGVYTNVILQIASLMIAR